MRIISEGRKYFRLCGTCCPLQVSRSISLLTDWWGEKWKMHQQQIPQRLTRVSLSATGLFLFCITEWEQALQQYLTKTCLSEIYMNSNMSWNAPYKSSDQDSLHHWVKMSHNIHNLFVWKKKNKTVNKLMKKKTIYPMQITSITFYFLIFPVQSVNCWQLWIGALPIPTFSLISRIQLWLSNSSEGQAGTGTN